MKKTIALLLFLCVCLSLASGAFAQDYTAAVNPSSVLLMNADSGEVLFSKNPSDRVYPASTTKILTALVVLDRVEDSSETVTVPAEALEGIHEGDDSTLVPMLKAGEQLSIRDLIYGLMLVSGNDTAAVLARHIAGSEEAFAGLMNEMAASLGMTNSHFTNPHGVQDSEHYSTAEDMAKLCKAAMDNAEFMQIVARGSYTIPATNLTAERSLINTNLLLFEGDSLPGTEYDYATGIKTGYTPTAGGCLVSTAEKNGLRLMCLVFGDSSDGQQERWFLSRDLFDYGFSLYADGEEAAAAESADTPPEEDSLPSPDENSGQRQGRGLWIVLSIAAFLAFGLLTLVSLARFEHIRRRRRRMLRRGEQMRMHLKLSTYLLPAAALLALAAAVFFLCRCFGSGRSTEPTEAGSETAEAVEEVLPAFVPSATAATDPNRWGVLWENTLSETRSLSFGTEDDYFALPGISGFRGGNWRSGSSWGSAVVENEFISVAWQTQTGSLTGGDGSAWTGSGWTGQPLIVQWDDATRNIMNLYPEKKAKSGLVEVIYATLDGNIYFLDLEDGSYTRDPISLGMAFKGSGALDPRGWPLMYVGSGDETADGQRPRMFILSLIDGSILYEYGHEESYALRRDNDSWCAFDSSPLVHAESDTLIWPGESGVLYTIRLNTSYDPAAGTLTIAPDEPVKARYDTARSGEESYWYGFECSPLIVDHYLYLSENGGMFFCIDLNTMDLVWAQDTRDDSNSTPVYESVSDTEGYLYTAPSLHWTADENSLGSVCIYKLDALTGEIVWTRSYDCGTVDGVSGGVQSSPLLGREGTDQEGLIIYPIARTPSMYSGLLVALDCRNGSEVWRLEMDSYTWSSPAAVYTASGKSYIVLFDSSGYANLIDGATGERLDVTDVQWLVEASPAVFNDKVVVGTRGQQIYGMTVY